MSNQVRLPADLFDFLRDLERNNDREWFAANKERYEESVRDPALAFIAAIGPELRKIVPHFQAIPRAQGGSLFRIYRDTRFGKDKTPYKTNTGLHFRHEAGKDAHAPGFYVHLAPGEVFFGAGLWRPAGEVVLSIRNLIVGDSEAWRQMKESIDKGPLSLTGGFMERILGLCAEAVPVMRFLCRAVDVPF
ncbi:MAG: TIGR02453 family protein [Spirochaetaceae bacterium]|nr:TIGR02453 family protein [Spirochaetaceae bacterium]MDT8298095.1 TIGR02453 family protein [Spirochaetaceae bacterium]